MIKTKTWQQRKEANFSDTFREEVLVLICSVCRQRVYVASSVSTLRTVSHCSLAVVQK